MSNERSTQFEYFAEMQARELMSIQGTAEYRTEEDVKQDLISILARQAYDFAVHVLASSRGNHLEDWQVQELLSSVPDMAELPPSGPVAPARDIPYGGYAGELISDLISRACKSFDLHIHVPYPENPRITSADISKALASPRSYENGSFSLLSDSPNYGLIELDSEEMAKYEHESI